MGVIRICQQSAGTLTHNTASKELTMAGPPEGAGGCGCLVLVVILFFSIATGSWGVLLVILAGLAAFVLVASIFAGIAAIFSGLGGGR